MDKSILAQALILTWLSFCAWQDWKTREVSNWLTLPPFLLSIGIAVWQGEQVWIPMVVGIVVCMWIYRSNSMGGADGKILLSLCVLSPASFLLSCCMIALFSLFWMNRHGRFDRYPAIPIIAASYLIKILFCFN